MSPGRALLLGLALASATAAQLAFDPVDAADTISLICAIDGPTDHPSLPPPPALVATAFDVGCGPIRVAIAIADRVRPTPPDAAPPLWVAPKTSPPRA